MAVGVYCEESVMSRRDVELAFWVALGTLAILIALGGWVR